MITEKAPGKLYIAGEYAVVENGNPAILVALDQFVTCQLTAAQHQTGRIISRQYQDIELSWRRQGDQLVVDQRDNPFSYIIQAIEVTEAYTRSCGRQLKMFDLTIDSDLDSDNGRKYGLGSSAAVTVAIVKALCRFYQLTVTNEKLFKLAAIAHFTVQKNGSLGDVAASVYGGWIAYHSFDRQWLAEQQQAVDLTTLINLPWPDLEVEPLPTPKQLRLLIGWTGKPASTSLLVDKISLFKAVHQQEYRQFLTDSQQCVTRMINGFRTKRLDLIQQQIRVNRQLLARLGQLSGVSIETPLLQKLCTIAEQAGGAAKTSGAGGGDCGIALIDNRQDVKQLQKRWQAARIQPLALHVFFDQDSKED
ncbi:phosphomevalonate kinase [uncultured Limosilactobacillus sp.]|uniref:phosphomevalonate kinase n=1 Tax=uncultured Limosilactobacillus sp. TaxID=2837629 RepID=UPI0026014919|nr:phosphomevalonate kinase [uncultured Limosilactobacillus sp.]